MKKIITFLFTILSLLFIVGCETTTNPTTTAPTPSNLQVSNDILYWTTNINVKEYLVEMTITENVTTYNASTSFDFSEFINPNIEKISFRVKALANNTAYTNDSEFSTSFTYENPTYIYGPIETEILTTSFLEASTAPDNWKYNYNASIYADKSLKFSNSGDSITSPSFNALSSFKVEAKILGKNASGDATITFYGLDAKGNVIESIKITGPITNSPHTIFATFTNTNIKKIKFEYTTKALGNFGLFEIHIFHLEKDEVTSITPNNLTTTYKIGDQFDYKGSLTIEYVSGIIEELNLLDIKDNIKITNFSTSKFDKETMTITYENISTTLDYVVTYDYPSLISSVDTSYISVLDSLIYISVDTIDIIINQSDSTDINDIINLLNNQSLEYYIAYDDISISNDVFLDLDDLNEYTYYITPTTSLTYTPNGILFSNYTTDILINTTNEIEESITKEYDYIITKYSSNLPKADNIIFNFTSTVEDYSNFDNLYQASPSTAIFDTTINEIIKLEINKETEQFNTTYNEISSLDIWDGNYYYIENNTPYNHEDYYTSIFNLTGSTLKEALTTLITSTHTNPVNYNYARDAYLTIEPDFDNPGNIILFYSGKSIDGTWDNGNTWNREHIWPKSLSGGLYTSVSGSTISAGSDLHQLRPASTSINSSRGNKPYGPTTNDTYFEPRDEIKGDVARILFYMSIRYDMDIEVLGVVSDLDLLLTWHESDPVDFYEMYRNEQIQAIQGNYNPFIDNPWLVELIFK